MSPLVPAAVLAVASGLFGSVWFWLGAAILLSGTGLSLAILSRTCAAALVLCSVCVIAGINSRTFAAAGDTAHLPLPEGSVTGIRVVIQDQPVVDRQQWRVAARVESVSSELLTATARFLVYITGDNNTTNGYGPGTRVIASVAGIRRAENGRWYATVTGVTPVGQSAAGKVRQHVHTRLSDSLERVAGDAKPLLEALLLGSRDELGVREEELFRRAGASHILALSGMHLAVLSGFVVFVARRFVGSRRALILGAVVALLYTGLIGARPSLVRATLMCEVGVAMLLAGRRPRLVELLALACILQVVIQPGVVQTLSFRLSYLALAGIAVGSPVIVRETRTRIPAAVTGSMSAGIAAQLATSPVLLASFGRIYPIGILAGAILGPVVTVLMIAGLIAAVIGLLPVPWIHLQTAWVLTALDHLVSGIAWWMSKARPLVASRGARIAGLLATSVGVSMYLVERRRARWTGPN